MDTMTRSEMIDFILLNHNIAVTHTMFADHEYIFSKEDGLIYDESGRVFEAWHTKDGWDGIRRRNDTVWENGWKISENHVKPWFK